jgi:two-component system, OmpR family, response regulator
MAYDGLTICKPNETTRTTMRLLLIEDDPTLGEGLRDFLRTEAHLVDWCHSLQAARGLQAEPYDAYLVDWQLPDGSGLEWLKARRARGDHTAAIMLTARDLLSDRITGLDAGADDYLVKPFEPEELCARLRALARRMAGTSSGRLSFGEVEIDLAAHQAWHQGQAADLTAREWAVLEALGLRAGRVVSKTDLERLTVGMDTDINSNALEVHISSLRRKLGRSLIDTVRGLGYRLGG